jgi:tetratricopeptide (TPR) repeat protein
VCCERCFVESGSIGQKKAEARQAEAEQQRIESLHREFYAAVAALYPFKDKIYSLGLRGWVQEVVPGVDKSGMLDRITSRTWELLNAIPHSDPRYAVVEVSNGLVLGFGEQKLDTAITHFERALQLAPTDELAQRAVNDLFRDVNGLLDYARRRMDEKKYKVASFVASKVMERHPDCTDAYILRAKVYQEYGSPDKAVADYTAAFRFSVPADRRDPSTNDKGLLVSPSGWVIGKADESHLDHYRISESSLTQEVKADLLFNRGLCKASCKDYQGAISDFTTVLAWNWHHADARYSRGLANYNGRNYCEAMLDYCLCLQIDNLPDDVRSKVRRGVNAVERYITTEEVKKWEDELQQSEKSRQLVVKAIAHIAEVSGKQPEQQRPADEVKQGPRYSTMTLLVTLFRLREQVKELEKQKQRPTGFAAFLDVFSGKRQQELDSTVNAAVVSEVKKVEEKLAEIQKSLGLTP